MISFDLLDGKPYAWLEQIGQARLWDIHIASLYSIQSACENHITITWNNKMCLHLYITNLPDWTDYNEHFHILQVFIIGSLDVCITYIQNVHIVSSIMHTCIYVIILCFARQTVTCVLKTTCIFRLLYLVWHVGLVKKG